MNSTNETTTSENNAWGRYLVALLVKGAVIGAGFLLGRLAQMLIVDSERMFVELIRELLIPVGTIVVCYNSAKTVLARRGFAAQVSGGWRLPAILFVGGLGWLSGFFGMVRLYRHLATLRAHSG